MSIDLREIRKMACGLSAIVGCLSVPAEDFHALCNEVEDLQEALAPFAKAAEYMTTGKAIAPEHAGIWMDNRSGCRVTVADFRRAAERLRRR